MCFVTVVGVVVVGDDGAGALIDFVAAFVAGEDFEVLQAVRLDAYLHGVAHDLEEIDEHAVVDQRTERSLRDAVFGRNGFEGGAFGVVVVVDVHAGIRSPPVADVADELPNPVAFLRLVMGPGLVVVPLSVGTQRHIAEEEEEAAVGPPEGVAFEVEEDVAVIGCGQELEPVTPDRVVARRDRQHRRKLVGRVACGDLERRLRAESFQPLGAHVGHRLRALGQSRHRGDIGRFERRTVELADPGDVDQRVLLSPRRFTARRELTEHAVVARLRSRFDLGPCRHDILELMPQARPIRARRLEPDRLRHAGTQRHPEVAWDLAGRRPQRFGVEAQLKHMAGLRLSAGELRINGVPPDGAGGGFDSSLEEVGDPTDAVMDERHLKKDIDIGAQFPDNPRGPVSEGLAGLLVIDTVNRQTRVDVAGLDRGLVLEPLVHEERCERPDRKRRTTSNPCLDLVLQRQIVRAVEPRGDLGRRQQPNRGLVDGGGISHLRSHRGRRRSDHSSQRPSLRPRPLLPVSHSTSYESSVTSRSPPQLLSSTRVEDRTRSRHVDVPAARGVSRRRTRS